ncbi:propanediol/glycerol family dehydratase large subunit [Shinella pollutisoli]|uniref:Propanediol/glycerol family dehydratase large subunit n=1 Tax=Shinella pollutisoli TaxID=2250594 RepID=A0ABV7DHD2_9HYPH|nr:propanediol/glycerol family dehydratase large subunit [Shinella pollutisoli]
MESQTPNRWKRFDLWDERPLRLDRFAKEDPEHGFSAVRSPADPKPSLRIEGGSVTELDGVAAADFDLIDEFIARYHIDVSVAEEAMATDSLEFARRLVDINVPRADVIRLARGMTPAKLVDVLQYLNTAELIFAQTKLRARKEPGNQAHVTNAKDDPLQLAADAATAVALGFDEIETTMRVASNGWSNALACAVGASVGRGGVLFQCSIEEAEELAIGMAGFTSYAETVSVYGTEGSFIDGDDTPWSKAFLTTAYASRGIKARCTSGGGSELLMGYHDAKSILYLEARCLCLQRGMGIQGTQNGGIDGAPITYSVPGGGREIFAENVLAALLDLECASGNDTRASSSEIRVGAKIMPALVAGTDFICSGFGSILAYDNAFAASLFNGEEIEDYLSLQRDYVAEGGLTPLTEDTALDVRERAVEAVSAVLDELGLATPTERQKKSVIFAAGSAETETLSGSEVVDISARIRSRVTAVDVVRALHKRGFVHEAQNLLMMLRLRVSGDYLQTAAIVRDGRVMSAVNTPNDYAGPGTGHRIDEERWQAIAAMRGSVGRADMIGRRGPRPHAGHSPFALTSAGTAAPGADPTEVVIGISPAWGISIHETTAGHPLADVLEAIVRGVAEAGGTSRIVRIRHTADTSFLGLTAARLSGSGYGIGIQAKGTAVIHQKDRLPHMNVELFSTAPLTTIDHYRRLGANAAMLAAGKSPEPVLVEYTGEAIHAKHHVKTALLFALETAAIEPSELPQEMRWEGMR